ncbi:hypothetical protein BJ138DRAFT_1153380 [Hygrophoropsis aurantiaca]|uniref:Uncharacterized protein n=1 Tax=Hygrophoropsis aurantiaca TaxID=72124 RepID=A0ACB8AC03_9AGAM|nr:hypothetical protein BJ138DRAFT_1153380 [Hygrophoropsis aurantiaca]
MFQHLWYSVAGVTLFLSALDSVYAGNTTCLSAQLDWYTDAVGESPCMTYQRLRQICDSDYQVPSFSATLPGDTCGGQNTDCCCNSVAWVLSMLCMNCQQDADPSSIAPGIGAPNGTYSTYIGTCGQSVNYTLPSDIQADVCSENIKISTYIYTRVYWNTGAWYYNWTRTFAMEQISANGTTITGMCANEVPSFSATSTTSSSVATSASPSTSMMPTQLPSNANTVQSSPSMGAIVGGVIGGVAAVAIIALAGLYYRRRNIKRPQLREGEVIDGAWNDQPPLRQNALSQAAAPSSARRVPPFSGPELTPFPHSLATSADAPRAFHSAGKLTPTSNSSQSSDIPQTSERSNIIVPSDSVDARSTSLSREEDAGHFGGYGPPTARLPPAYNPVWDSRESR